MLYKLFFPTGEYDHSIFAEKFMSKSIGKDVSHQKILVNSRVMRYKLFILNIKAVGRIFLFWKDYDRVELLA